MSAEAIFNNLPSTGHPPSPAISCIAYCISFRQLTFATHLIGACTTEIFQVTSQGQKTPYGALQCGDSGDYGPVRMRPFAPIPPKRSLTSWISRVVAGPNVRPRVCMILV